MPRLLDLFCGEGGAARGYARAGFDVEGVDQNPKVGRRYPYPFLPGDALEYARTFGRQYDVIHASPPCQLYSVSHNAHTKQHPDLLAPTRDVLDELGVPYVIENVPGAPMLNPITLCGAAFGLTATDIDGTPLVLRRHRLFESNLWLTPVECECLIYRDRGFKVGGAYGNGSETPEQAKVRGGGYTPVPAVRAELLGIGWMTRNGLSQSIPPAYTQYLGEQLLEHLDAEVAS